MYSTTQSARRPGSLSLSNLRGNTAGRRQYKWGDKEAVCLIDRRRTGPIQNVPMSYVGICPTSRVELLREATGS